MKRLFSKACGVSRDEFDIFIWLIRSYIWRHRFQFMMIWFSGMVVVWATGIVILMVKPALQAAFDNDGSISLVVLALIIMGASLTSGIFQYIQTIILEKTGLQIVAALRRDLYYHLLHMDVAYLSKNHVGELSTICMEETSLIRDITGSVFVRTIQDIVLFLVLFGVIIYRDWQLSLLALVAVPLIVIGKGQLTQRRRQLTDKLLERRAQITAWVSEVLFNARLVKIFSVEDRETERMRDAFEKQAQLHLDTLRTRSLSQPFNECISGGCIVAVMLVGSWRAETGDMSLPELTSILIALIAAYRPLKRLDDTGNRLQEGISASCRIKRLLDIVPTIRDDPKAKPIYIPNGSIVFQNVSFHYTKQASSLTNINITVPPGSMLGIVGPSGAGKTTLVNMIPRFFDPDTGKILIDGHDIKQVTQSSLRSQMAMITQETLLFDESIAVNISYGKPDATREEVVAAAKLAAADEFIIGLPNGYETMIGARGVRLSGGERQRISIARALIKKSKILILDEATSSLDNRTEYLIKKSIETGSHMPTRIVVAHRLGTIRNADQILVMHEGQIVERGTHETLLEQNGLYAELYRTEEQKRLDESATIDVYAETDLTK